MPGFGYIPDSPDPRDHGLVKLALPSSVPGAASITSYIQEILDQSITSKCVAHAFALAIRMVDKIAGIRAPQLMSRDFAYYNSLAFDGGGFVDQGTQLRSCAKGLSKFGRPPESACPFSQAPLVERPSWEAYRQAYDHKGPSAYLRVSGLTEIKQAIAANHPVVGGARVGESIYGYDRGVYDPDPNEAKIGGHALTVVAYDADSFTLANSWGYGFGESGLMRVSPRYMASFTDCWSVIR